MSAADKSHLILIQVKLLRVHMAAVYLVNLETRDVLLIVLHVNCCRLQACKTVQLCRRRKDSAI